MNGGANTLDPYGKAVDLACLALVAYLLPACQNHVTEAELLSGQFSPLPVDDAIRNQIVNFRNYLGRLTADNLLAICESLHSQSLARRPNSAESMPSVLRRFPPDVTYWARLASWTPDEAAVLLNDLDPSAYSWPLVIEPLVKVDSLAARLEQIREMLRRAVKKDELSEDPTPAEVLKWARQRAIEFPQELDRLLPRAQLSEKDSLQPKERRSVLLLIKAMWRLLQEKDPRCRNDFPSWLRDQMERLGLRVGIATIQKFLNEAEAIS